jgi:hypothetical protein
MSEHEQSLRELAYRLWEEAGYPEGRSDEFWYTALEILTSEPRPPAEPDAAPVPEAHSDPAAESPAPA